jgi:hypothetical protein
LRVLWLSFAVSAALSTAVARAQNRSEVINGATCLPYPNQASVGVPYKHWLYGFSQTAFCHLTMTTEWPLANLSFVLFEATMNSGTLTGRVCVHSGNFTDTCGSPATLTAPSSVTIALPPVVTPAFQIGAYMQFTLPPSTVTTIHLIIPDWFK